MTGLEVFALIGIVLVWEVHARALEDQARADELPEFNPYARLRGTKCDRV